ncbi:MAG: hypothetical protein HOM68_20295 [Gemmatimonadetes bacterium]|nr:hypothetical protein [Gemmatimonadota bacterium]MBT5144397.1 hypothetical protein [Gemmatimonadota bacterium]MBT5587085.1 hypothetical protein [Gemmatimonadota bacterium]MBT5960353.1 hypothetical protein [Gemmatimonadota bacterium]MBT7455399.1 hypothetical protein [Gemmatimonadota bacterium]
MNALEPMIVMEPILGVAILLGTGLVTALCSRHRLSLFVGVQLMTFAAARALAMMGQRDLGVLAIVFGLLVGLAALRLGQEAAAAAQPPEPPP